VKVRRQECGRHLSYRDTAPHSNASLPATAASPCARTGSSLPPRLGRRRMGERKSDNRGETISCPSRKQKKRTRKTRETQECCVVGPNYTPKVYEVPIDRRSEPGQRRTLHAEAKRAEESESSQPTSQPVSQSARTHLHAPVGMKQVREPGRPGVDADPAHPEAAGQGNAQPARGRVEPREHPPSDRGKRQRREIEKKKKGPCRRNTRGVVHRGGEGGGNPVEASGLGGYMIYPTAAGGALRVHMTLGVRCAQSSRLFQWAWSDKSRSMSANKP